MNNTNWALTIIKEVNIKKYKNWTIHNIVECKCVCWKTTNVYLANLKRGHTKSCWCLRIKHWMNWTRIYWIYNWIKGRCDNLNNKSYWWKWIKCEWWTFEEFYKDMKKWYTDNLTIDRRNNNWNYCKSNCRWVTQKINNRNKTTNIIYKWKCISEWAEITWINRSTIFTRIRRNWSIERALWFIS